MNDYYLRIELHNDQIPNDYNALHEALYTLQFYRAIRGDDNNQWFDLPNGTYYGQSPLDTVGLRDLIKDVLDKIFRANPAATGDKPKGYSILVIKPVEESWYLLAPADPDRLPK